MHSINVLLIYLLTCLLSRTVQELKIKRRIAEVESRERLINEHRVVMMDDEEQSLKQERRLKNITSCSSPQPTIPLSLSDNRIA